MRNSISERLHKVALTLEFLRVKPNRRYFKPPRAQAIFTGEGLHLTKAQFQYYCNLLACSNGFEGKYTCILTNFIIYKNQSSLPKKINPNFPILLSALRSPERRIIPGSPFLVDRYAVLRMFSWQRGICVLIPWAMETILE